MANYVVSGYTTPAGINSKDAVKELQKQLNAKGAGLVVDGVWGSKTEAAYKSSLSIKTDPYLNTQAFRVAQTNYAPMSVPKAQSATVSKTPKYALDIDSRAKAFVARSLEKMGKSTAKKDEAEYQIPQTSKVLTLPYNKMTVDSKPTIKNMPATAQDAPNVVHTFPKTEQPRSVGLPAVWEIELENALKKYAQQHPQDFSDKAVTANYGMGASNNKSPSQLRRDNQIKEEKIIANIRGATSYKISSSASSQDKLYDIIDRSYVLDDYARNRAKQTVEWLSEAERDSLLLDVMLDGPDAYFSRKAFAQGGYNMFFGRDDVRLFPDLVQPGEGVARQTYVQALDYDNKTNHGLAIIKPDIEASDFAKVMNKPTIQKANAGDHSIPPTAIHLSMSRNGVPQQSSSGERETDSVIDKLIEFFLGLFTKKDSETFDLSNVDPEDILSFPSKTSELTPVPVPNQTSEKEYLAEIDLEPEYKLPDTFTIPDCPLNTKNSKGVDIWKGRENEWNQIWNNVEDELLACMYDVSNGGLSTNQRIDILMNTIAHIGTPYGDEPGQIDCSGLVRAAYEAAGISLGTNSSGMAKMFSGNISEDELKPGDLIFWKKGTKVQHVGIYLCTDAKGKKWIIDSISSSNGPNVKGIWEGNGYVISGYGTYC